ncbi:hypothetical protein VNO80_33961 [Phaseolus coccineus]|uniref:Uncharacterized protein n=1 Tax=Phaseolus coccineus TaxID=3886 RepID=A0AAN9KXI0_PHACN
MALRLGLSVAFGDKRAGVKPNGLIASEWRKASLSLVGGDGSRGTNLEFVEQVVEIPSFLVLVENPHQGSRVPYLRQASICAFALKKESLKTYSFFRLSKGYFTPLPLVELLRSSSLASSTCLSTPKVRLQLTLDTPPTLGQTLEDSPTRAIVL